MKKTAQLMAEALILLVLVVCIAFAGGYQINEQGARATGMGGAFVARASDPSAIYYNPAGLATQKGINALAGVDFIIPSTTLKLTGGTSDISAESQVFTPVNLYGTYQVDDEIVVGLGVFNPFGLGTKWPATLGSFEGSIQTWYINPSVAYKIDDEWSVGLGVSYVAASAKIAGNGSSYEPTGSGFNVNVGAIYKAMPELSIGLSYRINTDIEFSGSMPVVGTTKVTLPMPGNLMVGAAYQVMPELTVEGDIQYVQWSAYDKLTLKYGNTSSVVDEGKWDDALTLRAGAEYKLDEEITLRGGLILDLSPQPPSKTTLMLPDSYRSDVSIGGTYKIDANISIDAAYMLVLFGERDAKNASTSGVYNTTAHVLSLNVAYAF